MLWSYFAGIGAPQKTDSISTSSVRRTGPNLLENKLYANAKFECRFNDLFVYFKISDFLNFTVRHGEEKQNFRCLFSKL